MEGLLTEIKILKISELVVLSNEKINALSVFETIVDIWYVDDSSGSEKEELF